MKTIALPLFVVLGSLAVAAAPLTAVAGSIPIDATNFSLGPDAVVTFNPDGSALLAEDPNFGLSQIFNDPAGGDPLVIEALPGGFLSFDYDFQYGALDTDDSFTAVLLDSGVAIGSPYEFFIDAPGAGQVVFDLSGLVGTADLGIDFSLTSGDFDFESTILLSNLRTFQVPVPATALLLVVGLIGVGVNGRRQKRSTQATTCCLSGK